jgi:tether containing UBX domain for GLUT4
VSLHSNPQFFYSMLEWNLDRSASDAPLMTRAMRAVRDEMRLEKYEKSIARVYFPDRWVLQGCFRPRESLKMLVKFVRENLADPNVKFHLYTTPPKKVLRSAKITFAEAEFLPTAVVYVGVEDDQPHPTLSDSALQQAASSLQAEIVHQKNRYPILSLNRSHTEKHQTVQPHPERGGPSHHPPSSLPSPVPGSSGQARVGGSSDGASPSKLPKWFHGPR